MNYCTAVSAVSIQNDPWFLTQHFVCRWFHQLLDSSLAVLKESIVKFNPTTAVLLLKFMSLGCTMVTSGSETHLKTWILFKSLHLDICTYGWMDRLINTDCIWIHFPHQELHFSQFLQEGISDQTIRSLCFEAAICSWYTWIKLAGVNQYPRLICPPLRACNQLVESINSVLKQEVTTAAKAVLFKVLAF